MVFIDHDLGIRIYKGDFYLAVTLASDIFGFGVLIGCAIAWHRRFIEKNTRLHNRSIDSATIGVLALLIIQGFLLEGLRIHVTNDPWASYSPVGLLVAKLFWAMPSSAATNLHFFTWWFHTLTVYSIFALLPYTKFFHIISSSANLFFSNLARPKGALKFPGDLEKLMESGEEFTLGMGTIKDYSWKELLELDACTSCGRCQEVCPAYISGKPLSPKWLILDSRNHALSLQANNVTQDSLLPEPTQKIDQLLLKNMFLAGSGLEKSSDTTFRYREPAFRSNNENVQNSVVRLGGSQDSRIAGEIILQDVFWSCTTCMACVEACPVGINHVDHIIGNRRNMALMHGEIPQEAQPTLRALENRGNPFGAPQDRIKWLDGLDVRILKPGDSVDYLYWVGCVSSFDPRKQKIAKALVRLMQEAKLSFGILGNVEGCSGDPARRLGEENLFQTLAKSNIELLKSISFKTVVANCPHCFNTIKNEYPQLGNLSNGASPEIVHHSTLIKDLLKNGLISVKEKSSNITFHDPCYLGRYNGEYQAPRDIIDSISESPINEMDRIKEKGLCCGAGGGHFWMDLKIGDRVNVIRVEEAAKTGANTIATACPFCMQMMEDGVKLKNQEDTISVKDIAELTVESLK